MADQRAENRKQFRRAWKKGKPELRSFLERELELPGRVQCYSTTVPNPTQQLKNKLSQAAPIRGGLLCLTVADDEAREKATEALIERWPVNPNWQKAVSAVALVTEIQGRPEITNVIECRPTDHGQKIRERLFPNADVRRIQSSTGLGPEGDGLPRNLILYGPPGTGKSYSAIERAVLVCDGHVPDDRRTIVERYKELRAANRIDFVTFHQSFGYEEFVEGIRPVTQRADSATLEEPEPSSTLSFDVMPGVFKTICALAGSTPHSKGEKGTVDVHRARFWKMSLGNTQNPDSAAIYERCLENGWLLLGYGHGLDYSNCDDRSSVLQKIRADADPSATGTNIHVSTVHALKNKMADGDLVIVSDGNLRFRAIGEVAGPYEFREEEDYQQSRPVKWLAVFEESQPRERISSKSFSMRTLYKPDREGLKLDAIAEVLDEAAKGESPQSKNYVLVIDEINRGNISKILGELITLLEEDKRVGAPNELRARLPHSGDDFGVPPNVYVIGTMNTADRSIAFLDTALRRRFEFEEMMPDSNVLRDLVGQAGVIGDVDVAALLDRVNERVDLLYDRDHQIGHAYFIGVETLEDLRHVFVKKVIPLLREYFYGDWERLCHVLGCPFSPEDGTPLSRNRRPLIAANALLANDLLVGDPGFETKIRCRVSGAFLRAEEDELGPYFTGIVGDGDSE